LIIDHHAKYKHLLYRELSASGLGATSDNFLRTQDAVMAGNLKLIPPTFRIGFPVVMCFSAFLGLAII
jgi:hypothetical protein